MKNMYASFYDAKTKTLTKSWGEVKDCEEDRLTYHESVILQMYNTIVELCQSMAKEDRAVLETMLSIVKLAVNSMYNATEMYRYDVDKTIANYEQTMLNDSDIAIVCDALAYAREQSKSSHFDIDPLGYASEPIDTEADYQEAVAAIDSDITDIVNKLYSMNK